MEGKEDGLGMDSQVALLNWFPHFRHLYCTSWNHELQCCEKGLTLPCGRNFDPKGGWEERIPA